MILPVNCLVGVILTVVGVIFKLWHPEQINNMMGYRTPFSKKNKETWKEANRFSAAMMIAGGILSIFISIIITFLYKNSMSTVVSISSMCSIIITLSLVLYTEIHLRKIFDSSGKRKL